MANLSNINNRFLVTTGGNVLIGQTGAVGTPIFQVTGTSTFAGNVGINETSLTEKLEVDGAIVWKGALTTSKTSAGVLDRSGDSLRIRAYGATAGSGNLHFRTGGGAGQVDTLALTLDSSQNATFAGNVGINTTATNAILIVTGAVSDDWAGRFENTSTDGFGILAKINSTSSGDYIFQARTGTTNVMTILGDGDVGIGTTTPNTKLEISGNNTSRNTIQNILTINGGVSASNPYPEFGMGIKFDGRDYGNAIRDYAYIQAVAETSGLPTAGGDLDFSSQLRFYTNTGGAANTLPTQKMTIYASGNVETTGNLIINKFSNTAPYADGEIRFTGRYDRYVGGIKTFTDNASYPEYANGLDFFVQRHVYALPNGHLAMRIDSEGTVGIGTDSPGTYGPATGTVKLDVKSGDIIRSGFTDPANSWIGFTALPGYNANQYPSVTSKSSIHFANNDKYCAFLEGTDTYFGILNSASTTKVFLATGSQNSYLAGSGNVGIGITNPQDKLHVNGDAIIGSTKFGDFATASINTTGFVVATVGATTNGQSAIVEFVASGNNGGYYNVVYSCYNGGGLWYYTKNVVGSGGNIEVAEINGAGSSTLSFSFRSTSGTAAYTPRVMMKGMPYNLVTF